MNSEQRLNMLLVELRSLQAELYVKIDHIVDLIYSSYYSPIAREADSGAGDLAQGASGAKDVDSVEAAHRQALERDEEGGVSFL